MRIDKVRFRYHQFRCEIESDLLAIRRAKRVAARREAAEIILFRAAVVATLVLVIIAISWR